jgi:hypothetical protein
MTLLSLPSLLSRPTVGQPTEKEPSYDLFRKETIAMTTTNYVALARWHLAQMRAISEIGEETPPADEGTHCNCRLSGVNRSEDTDPVLTADQIADLFSDSEEQREQDRRMAANF